MSDSLFPRSPLCIATPYDLHVLATPPAFRLSQDQTLQLNFLARPPPHARCGPCRFRVSGWPGLTVLEVALILEMSLSKLIESRPIRSAVTARRPATTNGSVEPSYRPVRIARLKHLLAPIPAWRWDSNTQ